MAVSRDNNGNIPILYIEFEDDRFEEIEDPSAAVLIEPPQFAQMGGWRGEGPRPRAASARRVLAAGLGTLLGLGALTGVSLAAQAGQAEQRALARAPLALTAASYAPDPAGNGYDLLLGLFNAARDPVTLLAVAVHQPGMTMVEGEGPIVIGPAARTEVIVGGWFDCTGTSAPDATTVLVTLAAQDDSVLAQRLGLPAAAGLPASWRAERTSYCRAASADAGSGP
jgi:hypothetical protein